MSIVWNSFFGIGYLHRKSGSYFKPVLFCSLLLTSTFFLISGFFIFWKCCNDYALLQIFYSFTFCFKSLFFLFYFDVYFCLTFFRHNFLAKNLICHLELLLFIFFLLYFSLFHYCQRKCLLFMLTLFISSRDFKCDIVSNSLLCVV